MAFTHRLVVRFEDVDYAQIVFYPRLYQYTHWAFEEFFRVEVGVPYATMLSQRRTGFPTVHCRADFRAPLRFGDPCRIELATLKVSSRSIACRYRLFLGESDTLCSELEVITAVVNLDTFKATHPPEDVRQAFARHLEPAPAR